MVKDSVKTLAESYFAKFETRVGRKEKDAFLERTKQGFRDIGYTDAEIQEQKSFLGGKNLVVGAPDAKYLFTAHYDTPGRNGWLFMPFSKILGMSLASLVGMIILAILMMAPNILLPVLGVDTGISPALETLLRLFPFLLFILLIAVKNPHNHNDNTSGCIGVYNAAAILAENPDLRKDCAFVLFDMEEQGLFGSGAFAKWRRKNFPGAEDSHVFNLDCIADGDLLILASKKKPAALKERESLAEFFQGEGFDVMQKVSSLAGYLSDHAKFKKGVMFAFLRRSKLGGLYIPNIHTSKDTVCDLEQIERLCQGIVKYISTR